MKSALELGHELAGESQQAITEAVEARDREVEAKTLRLAASVVKSTWRSRKGTVELLESMADQVPERPEDAAHAYEEWSAKQVVDAIVYDICDRRGLKREWAQIDSDVQEEIKRTWAAIIDAYEAKRS